VFVPCQPQLPTSDRWKLRLNDQNISWFFDE